MTVTYAIALVADREALSQSQQDWLLANIKETSWDTVRVSLTDPSEFICKWYGEKSDSSANPLIPMGVAHTLYTCEELCTEMHGNPHWEEVE